MGGARCPGTPGQGWAMVELRSEADIRCPAEKIFDVITDFGGQDRWLAPSSAFHGTTGISPGPVTLGTTYREPGPFGVRNGTVTEVDRPAKITFHQPMTMKFRAGTIDVRVRYTLVPAGEQAHPARAQVLRRPAGRMSLPGRGTPAQPGTRGSRWRVVPAHARIVAGERRPARCCVPAWRRCSRNSHAIRKSRGRGTESGD